MYRESGMWNSGNLLTLGFTKAPVAQTELTTTTSPEPICTTPKQIRYVDT